MSDKKHIDRLFQEKLKDFEVSPNDEVWNNIHDRLHKDKRKRRVIPIWWKLAGVAAILLLLFTVGSQFNWDGPNNNTTNSVVDTKKTTTDGTIDSEASNSTIKNSSERKNDIINSPAIAEEPSSENSETIADDRANESKRRSKGSQNVQQYLNSSEASKSDVVSGSNSKRTSSDKTKNNNNSSDGSVETEKNAIATTSTHSKFSETEKGILKKDAIAKTDLSGKSSNNTDEVQTTKEQSESNKLIIKSQSNIHTTVSNTPNTEETKADDPETVLKEQSIEDAIAEASTEPEKEEEKTLNRWNVSPNVAPVYFNSLGKGSSLDEQFVNNEKTGSVNMSYGINGSYAISEKIKVRAGVNRVELGYSTSDIIVYQDIGRNSNPSSLSENTSGHIALNSNHQNTALLSAKIVNFANAPEILNTTEQVDLDQQFGYIELPMELEYSVINARFGLNVIGGFSTLFLNKNEIYSEVDGNNIQIGEANNINDLSYSANFGFGINYNFSEKIKLNVEPTFKYQINTFNDSSGDFQPFFIGVYTGLSYKF